MPATLPPVSAYVGWGLTDDAPAFKPFGTLFHRLRESYQYGDMQRILFWYLITSLLHLSSWVFLPCSLPVLLLLQMGYEGKRKIP